MGYDQPAPDGSSCRLMAQSLRGESYLALRGHVPSNTDVKHYLPAVVCRDAGAGVRGRAGGAQRAAGEVTPGLQTRHRG